MITFLYAIEVVFLVTIKAKEISMAVYYGLVLLLAISTHCDASGDIQTINEEAHYQNVIDREKEDHECLCNNLIFQKSMFLSPESSPSPYWINSTMPFYEPGRPVIVTVRGHVGIDWVIMHAISVTTHQVKGTWLDVSGNETMACANDHDTIVAEGKGTKQVEFLWRSDNVSQETIQFHATVYKTQNQFWTGVISQSLHAIADTDKSIRHKRNVDGPEVTSENQATTMTLEYMTELTPNDSTTNQASNMSTEKQGEIDGDTDEFVLIGTIVVSYVGMYVVFSFLMI